MSESTMTDAERLREAYEALTDVPGDPPPFESVARAICEELGITRELVRTVEAIHRDLKASGRYHTMTAASRQTLDALSTLLDAAGTP